MAQNELATISGTVTTKTKPIPFADIYVMNSTVGTSTDIDGKFTLNVPSEKTIVIVAKLLGFRSMTKQISIEAC
jgi:outer membrane receptor for ferrienterochelin and colicins